MPETKVTIFIGNIIHCPEKLKLEVLENGFVAVENNKIIAAGDGGDVEEFTAQFPGAQQVILQESQILIPGLVDTHIHAPQYPNCGLGLDKGLLDWLDTYTFKLERKYKDLKFAETVFDAVVRKTLDHGTTTASYFASLFTDASILLVDSVVKHGQRALIGKVNMTESPFPDYVETKQESLANTAAFIENVLSRKNELVQPVITPRFALSMDMEHMTELGNVARNNDLPIQTHISENKSEIVAVENIFGMSYANVYDKSNLLTENTILAHGVHLMDTELKLIAKRKCSIAHCPSSNTCLKSGLCDVKRLLSNNIKVGLGTDISGGPSPSIVQAMRAALDVSVHLSFGSESYEPLTYKDVFYLATLGGAEALGMKNKTGNFQQGKEFDALIVDMNTNSTIDHLLECTPLEVLQKFVYCGDDRNVIRVYVAGKCVKAL